MISRLALVAVFVWTTACGGGGGGGDGGSGSAVSAGADRSARLLERVNLEPSSAQAVAGWEWSQVAGPSVVQSTSADGVLSFTATPFPATLEFEVIGRGPGGGTVGSDRAFVTVRGAATPPTLQQRSTITINGGGAGRAADVALHQGSRRLFTVDRQAQRVVVHDVSDASSPSFAGSIGAPAPIPGTTPGEPLAVACGDAGAVAITWSGEAQDFPGRVQFVDPQTLVELSSFSTTGANPVDVDVTPDGRWVAIACAGDRSTTVQGDGRGYLTLVEVPAAGAAFIDSHQNVSPIPFSLFDGEEGQLASQGVRFLGPFAPRASVDLAPRAVAIADDGSRAFAVCSENNCVITVDVATQLVTDIAALPDRVSGSPARGAGLDGTLLAWRDAPTFIDSPAGDALPVGGFQGIVDAQDVGANVRLRVVQGSGPALAAVDLDGDGVRELPLAAPLRGLGVLEILVSQDGEVLSVAEPIQLRDGNGAPIVGAPEAYPTGPGLAGHDERAVDLFGQPVVAPALGARLSGATVGSNGELWFADSRRCAIWRFSSGGDAIARYVPEGAAAGLGDRRLPAALARRRVNLDLPVGRRFGGFAALAYDAGRGSIFALTRLPLDTPDTPDDAASRASRILRLIELSSSTGTVLGEYAVPSSGPEFAAEGLALGPSSAPFDGSLVLLESAPGAGGASALFRLDLTGATNLRNLGAADYAAIDAVLESTALGDLNGLTPPIVPVTRQLALDLGNGGDGPPPSGLSFIGDKLIVAYDDGGLGLQSASFNPASGRIDAFGPGAGGALLTGSVRGLVFDTAVDGAGPASVDFVPAVGLEQPTGAVALGSGDAAHVLLAGGGAPRVLLDAAGAVAFDERVRVSDLSLDTNRFPNAAAWRPIPFGGDLIVSELDSDRNNDGLAERLALFGSRGLTLVDVAGDQRWSSGPALVEWARALRPERVEAASEFRGIEPRAVASVVLGGQRYTLTTLRGAGLLAVHDASSVSTPRLASLRSVLERPSAVAAYPAGSAAIVAIADEDGGRVALYRLAR